jgi:hypothetical protein
METGKGNGGNDQWSIVNCYTSIAVALRAIYFLDAAPQAHPKMTHDN